jgi:hypothetical protein
MYNKALPPTPMESLAAKGIQKGAQVMKPGPGKYTAMSLAQRHQSVKGELFTPLQQPEPINGGPWGRQALRISTRDEKARKRTSKQPESGFSPDTIDDRKGLDAVVSCDLKMYSRVGRLQHGKKFSNWVLCVSRRVLRSYRL